MENTKKETRGGFRPGSGRKKSPEAKIQVATRLHPEVVKILRGSDLPIAQHIEMAILRMQRDQEAGELTFDEHLAKD